MSEHIYRHLVHELAISGTSDGRPKHEIREEIVARVHAAADDGESWAIAALERWDREGAEKDYEKAHTALNATIYITRDGRRKRKTTSYSLPKRDVATGEVTYEQKTLWDYERPQLKGKRAELAAQRGHLDDAVAIFDRIDAVWDRHPECRTARQAWEADGHSVSEVDLSALDNIA
jgi:hypothetical protein